MRRCLLPPPAALFEVAQHLSDAVNFHLDGDRQKAETIFANANRDDLRNWTVAVWGAGNSKILQLREVEFAPALVPTEERFLPRMPNKALQRELIERDGYNCRYCGAPVIRKDVCQLLHRFYPDAVPWGRTDASRHAAFQAMWLQFEHLLPHSRGGETSMENMIIACAPCNFGKDSHTLEELSLADPRDYPISKTGWDGLDRVVR